MATINGTAGNDLLTDDPNINSPADTLNGYAGDDTLYGLTGYDTP